MMYLNFVPTLSIGDMLTGLWEGLVSFFDMIGSLVMMIVNLFTNLLSGMAMMISYAMNAVPITLSVIGVMPAIIMAAASVTLLIFILRFVFGAFVG